MLQQTQVSRVLPAYAAWVRRWPRPSELAADSPASAVRMWGDLGYPRRALRLHATAGVISEQYDDEVPAAADELRKLPGIGDYTAAAVAAFAHRRRSLVLDTNVRRVLARAVAGVRQPPATLSVAERELADGVWPDDGETAARWSVAVMELGALVCRAKNPVCSACPVSTLCAWRAAGFPQSAAPPPRRQVYAGSDRHCRGNLLALVRSSDRPVAAKALCLAWPGDAQRTRALQSLLADGLLVEVTTGCFGLPELSA
jgi:A/G-specific adenine glycosylase